MKLFFSQLLNHFQNVNFFESGSTDENIIRRERWSTRLYLFLLIFSILILVIYTSFQNETVFVTVQSPSLETFTKLQLKYPNILKCPCSQIAVKYEHFLHLEPIYHQVKSMKIEIKEKILLYLDLFKCLYK